MKLINVTQIVSVKKMIGYYRTDFQFVNHRPKSFWKSEIKEGFYKDVFDGFEFFTADEIVKNNKFFIGQDNRVCYKPYLEIKLSNDKKEERFFETEEELNDFLKSDELKGITLIEVN